MQEKVILQATGISTLLVTHDHNEIPLLADRVTIIQDGRIVQSCATPEAFARPVNETAAALLGVNDPYPFGAGLSGASR